MANHALSTPIRCGCGVLKRELLAVQYLRGLAAMLVVIFHLGVLIGRMGYSGDWPSGLSGGVDIFFVISGFIMWITTAERRVTPGAFWLNRIIRIVPLYWIITTVMVTVMLIAPSVLQSSRFEAHHVIASYLFIPWHHPLRPEMSPVVLPGWTLNYEMFFYLIFGLCLLLPSRWRLSALVGALVLLVGAGIVTRADPATIFGFYSASIMLEFAFGAVLGRAFLAERGFDLLGKGTALVVLLVALAAMVAMPSSALVPRVVRYGLPALVVVYAGLTLDLRGVREHRLLHEIGNASYSIYLSQLLTMAAFTAVWRKLHLDALPGAIPIYCVAVVAITALVGWICYRVVEGLMTKWLKSLARGRTEPPGNFETTSAVASP
jgi:exopolysaccharide production protein ExoZ